MQVTINVPDATYRRAEYLARVSRRPVADVLADSLEHSLPLTGPLKNERAIAELSNGEVEALMELQLPPEQDQRLSQLLDRQQAGSLQLSEQVELTTLMMRYQEGLLRKAESLQEAVRRGLRGPLTP